MSERTVSEVIESVRRLAEARRIECRVHLGDNETAINCTGCTEGEPDPAIAPLLALVSEQCQDCGIEALPDGATEGALIKALIEMYDVGLVQELLRQRGDTRLPALLLVEQWLKVAPSCIFHGVRGCVITTEEFPSISREAVEKADLPSLIVSMLVRLGQLEKDVAALRRQLP